jgi:hypothetical protein
MLCLAAVSSPVRATPGSGANCVGCHTTARNAMSLVGSTKTLNLAPGNYPAYSVEPGQTAAIRFNVADGHNSYAVAMGSLNVTGVSNATHRLTATPDATWTARSGYYTTATSSANREWTFNLRVDAATPPDVYLVESQIAGRNGGRWGERERFYVEVLAPAPPPAPTITQPTRTSTNFTVSVATVTGRTYVLEFKPDVVATNWTVATQTTGDGTTKTLSDSDVSKPQAVYRVRVQ